MTKKTAHVRRGRVFRWNGEAWFRLSRKRPRVITDIDTIGGLLYERITWGA